MRAFLIDPYLRSVKRVEWSGRFAGDRGAYEYLSIPGHKGVDAIAQAGVPLGPEVLLVDEDGKLEPDPAWWLFVSTQIVGAALLTTVDQNGEHTDVDIGVDIPLVMDLIKWS